MATKKDAKDDAVEEAEGFEGQTIRNDHFSVITGDSLGRPLAHIAPVGYVGDAPLVIPGWKVQHLIEALQAVKNLPSAPEGY